MNGPEPVDRTTSTGAGIDPLAALTAPSMTGGMLGSFESPADRVSLLLQIKLLEDERLEPRLTSSLRKLRLEVVEGALEEAKDSLADGNAPHALAVLGIVPPDRAVLKTINDLETREHERFVTLVKDFYAIGLSAVEVLATSLPANSNLADQAAGQLMTYMRSTSWRNHEGGRTLLDETNRLRQYLDERVEQLTAVLPEAEPTPEAFNGLAIIDDDSGSFHEDRARPNDTPFVVTLAAYWHLGFAEDLSQRRLSDEGRRQAQFLAKDLLEGSRTASTWPAAVASFASRLLPDDPIRQDETIREAVIEALSRLGEQKNLSGKVTTYAARTLEGWKASLPQDDVSRLSIALLDPSNKATDGESYRTLARLGGPATKERVRDLIVERLSNGHFSAIEETDRQVNVNLGWVHADSTPATLFHRAGLDPAELPALVGRALEVSRGKLEAATELNERLRLMATVRALRELQGPAVA